MFSRENWFCSKVDVLLRRVIDAKKCSICHTYREIFRPSCNPLSYLIYLPSIPWSVRFFYLPFSIYVSSVSYLSSLHHVLVFYSSSMHHSSLYYPLLLQSPNLSLGMTYTTLLHASAVTSVLKAGGVVEDGEGLRSVMCRKSQHNSSSTYLSTKFVPASVLVS